VIAHRIVPNLWFDTEAEQAVAFYCSIFPDSRVLSVARYPEGAPGPAGSVMTVEFELFGQPFVAINGGPHFTPNEAVSLAVVCEDQAEVDRYWAALTDGGQEGQCGWLKDRWGFSWQVYERGIDQLLGGDDPEAAARAFAAMTSMTKLDSAALRAAAEGVSVG
jgi:predicted 3-demethylubiquinone-9 3-methyltransferase (glyoxalase superfamily)